MFRRALAVGIAFLLALVACTERGSVVAPEAPSLTLRGVADATPTKVIAYLPEDDNVSC